MSKTSKRAAFYHDLAVLLEAGLPILRALDTVTAGLRGNPQKVFSDVRKSVSQGNGLSESMAKHQDVFAVLDVTLVETAELSGKLPECFKLLCNWYEFRNRLHGIIKSGLIIPLLVLHFSVFIIPLPGMVLGQTTIGGYFIIVLKILAFFYMSFFIILVVYKLMRRNSTLNEYLDAMILRIPVLGQAVWQLSICRYCRAFNMLYKAGVPIAQSLTQATKLAGNLIVSRLFEGGAISATEGNIASDGFSDRLPSEYLNLWRIGEETGELEKTVDKIAQISGDKAELLLTESARWFPRLIYVLICIWLLIQVLKGYANIYSMRNF